MPFKPMRTKTPETSLPLEARGPHLIHHPLTEPTHYLKQHPDPISHFATIHLPDIDKQTDLHMG